MQRLSNATASVQIGMSNATTSKSFKRDTSPSVQNSNGSHSHSVDHLLGINDRLTRQIEDNLALFEELHQELGLKDRAIAENKRQLLEKEREVERLMRKLNDMGEHLKQLLTAKASDSQHEERMRHLRLRQDEYQRKIDRIARAFTGADGSLRCVPLKATNSRESSRVHDEELSLGQIGADEDAEPTRLGNKENAGPRNSDSRGPMSLLENTGESMRYSQDNTQSFAGSLKKPL